MRWRWETAFALAAVALALLAGSVGHAPATAIQMEQEKEVLAGKEHNFGDAFILSLGGKLYDDYWAGSGSMPPATRNPDFPDDLKVSKLDSWRCVSCHGWDYGGAERQPDSVQQQKQFASVQHLQGMDPYKVSELFTKAHPDHPAQSNRELPTDLLILFLSIGQHKINLDALNKPLPPQNLGRGQDIFEGVCMACHDPEGTSGLEDAGVRQSLGWIARNKPKRALHKIINGVPGQSMLALRFAEDGAIVDLLGYLRTLDPGSR